MGFPMKWQKKNLYLVCLGYIMLGTPLVICSPYECHQSLTVHQLGCTTQLVSLKVISPVWGLMTLEVGRKGKRREQGSCGQVNEEAALCEQSVLSSSEEQLPLGELQMAGKILNQN